MTTSQASRVYGIPYNSLLMYVRGKYGKSLKRESADIAGRIAWGNPLLLASCYLELEKALPRKLARWLPYRVPRWANGMKTTRKG